MDPKDDDPRRFSMGADALARFYSDLLGRTITPEQIYMWHRRRSIPTRKFNGKLLGEHDEMRRALANLPLSDSDKA